MIYNKTLLIPQGSDRAIHITMRVLTDPSKDFNKDTNPWIIKDLSGYSARMKIKEDYNTPDVVISYTSEDNIVIDELNGKVSIAILGLDTESIILDEEYVDYVYDVEIYSGTYVQRILSGKFRLLKNVTD